MTSILVLTPADLQHMDKKSYVVVPEAVDSTDLAAVVDGIWDHMVMDRDNSTT